jgi:hypothetical protein
VEQLASAVEDLLRAAGLWEKTLTAEDLERVIDKIKSRGAHE